MCIPRLDLNVITLGLQKLLRKGAIWLQAMERLPASTSRLATSHTPLKLLGIISICLRCLGGYYTQEYTYWHSEPSVIVQTELPS